MNSFPIAFVCSAVLLVLASRAESVPDLNYSKAIGESCAWSHQCSSGRCDNRAGSPTQDTCIKATATTGRCVTNADCTTNNCDNKNACKASETSGPCSQDRDCVSKNCDVSTWLCVAPKCVMTPPKWPFTLANDFPDMYFPFDA